MYVKEDSLCGVKFWGLWQLHRLTSPAPQPWYRKLPARKHFLCVPPSQSIPPSIVGHDSGSSVPHPVAVPSQTCHVNGMSMCSLLSLAAFTKHDAFDIHPCCCMRPQLDPLIIEYHSMGWRSCSFLSILQLRDSVHFLEIISKTTISISAWVMVWAYVSLSLQCIPSRESLGEITERIFSMVRIRQMFPKVGASGPLGVPPGSE